MIQFKKSTLESTYDVMFYDSICMVFNDEIILNQGMGGSEFVIWQIANEMGQRGLRVLINQSNNTSDDYTNGNVTYKFGPIDRKITVTNLVHHRLSDTNYEHNISWIDRSILCTDLWGEHYKKIYKIVDKSKVICVSQWHKNQFPSDWNPIFISNPLPDYCYAQSNMARDPRSFIYASAALKGLKNTIIVWKYLKDNYSVLKDAKLKVFNPGYENSSIQNSYEDYGIEFHGSLPFAKILKEFQTSAGLFYINDFPETFCIVAALAEASGARVHCLMRNGGAISETVNSKLVTDSLDIFIKEFLFFYKSETSNNSFNPKNYRVKSIVDQWFAHFQINFFSEKK